MFAIVQLKRKNYKQDKEGWGENVIAKLINTRGGWPTNYNLRTCRCGIRLDERQKKKINKKARKRSCTGCITTWSSAPTM